MLTLYKPPSNINPCLIILSNLKNEILSPGNCIPSATPPDKSSYAFVTGACKGTKLKALAELCAIPPPILTFNPLMSSKSSYFLLNHNCPGP